MPWVMAWPTRARRPASKPADETGSRFMATALRSDSEVVGEAYAEVARRREVDGACRTEDRRRDAHARQRRRVAGVAHVAIQPPRAAGGPHRRGQVQHAVRALCRVLGVELR